VEIVGQVARDLARNRISLQRHILFRDVSSETFSLQRHILFRDISLETLTSTFCSSVKRGLADVL
jgi:hypothetical protein